MAPRSAARRERNNDYSAVGKAGRRTGVTLPPGKLDENGLEEITGLFSSPAKATPDAKQDASPDRDRQHSTSEIESGEDMVGMDSSGLTPTQTLSARRSLGAPVLPPPPRSASPRKSGISGSPRRSNGINIATPSKPAEFADAEDRENTPTPTPTLGKPRRFLPSPEKRPLRQVVSNGPAVSSAEGKDDTLSPASRDASNGVQPEQAQSKGSAADEPVNENQSKANQEPDISVVDEGYVPNAIGDDEEVDEVLSILNNSIQDGSPVAASAKKDFPENLDTAGRDADPVQQIEKRRQEPAVQPRNGKKRKSVAVDKEKAAPPSPPPAKKARTAKKPSSQAKGKQKIGPAVGQEFHSKPVPVREPPTSKQVRTPGLAKDPNAHLSQRQQAELDQIIEKVKARPGKLKSLYVLKREKSKNAGADDVRSGRAVIKPLAYWSAEQCIQNDGCVGLELGSRIPLNSVKEITRDGQNKSKRDQHQAEEDDDGDSSSSDDTASLNDHYADGHEEAWEKEIGVYRGQARMWSQTDQQTLPPHRTEETDLAYHPSSILTRSVGNNNNNSSASSSSSSTGGGFKYAKLISMPFFGSGVVDLPVGTTKRPKNSNSMQMAFFVFKGRVTVRIGMGVDDEPGRTEGEEFSIAKGGMFQVPRGNRYSIENVLDKPARLFFTQACETVPDDGD